MMNVQIEGIAHKVYRVQWFNSRNNTSTLHKVLYAQGYICHVKTSIETIWKIQQTIIFKLLYSVVF